MAGPHDVKFLYEKLYQLLLIHPGESSLDQIAVYRGIVTAIALIRFTDGGPILKRNASATIGV